MKINYTAIVLTVLALAGLTIYRLLTPEEFLMILTKPEHDNDYYFAKSSDGLQWDILNDREPRNIYLGDHLREPQIIKENNYTYRIYGISNDCMVQSLSENLLRWEKPELIEGKNGSENVFSETNKVRVVYKKGDSPYVFCLYNNGDKSVINLLKIGDENISDESLKILSSEEVIVDFKICKLEKFYIMTVVHKESLSKELKLEFFKSSSIEKDWNLAAALITDSFEWVEPAALQKNNEEFWLYGKQNGIISVRLNKNSNQLQAKFTAKRSDIPKDYILVSGFRLRKDILKNLRKDLNRRK